MTVANVCHVVNKYLEDNCSNGLNMYEIVKDYCIENKKMTEDGIKRYLVYEKFPLERVKSLGELFYHNFCVWYYLNFIIPPNAHLKAESADCEQIKDKPGYMQLLNIEDYDHVALIDTAQGKTLGAVLFSHDECEYEAKVISMVQAYEGAEKAEVESIQHELFEKSAIVIKLSYDHGRALNRTFTVRYQRV